MIKAVLFDWDGTILDNREVIMSSYRAASTEVLGYPIPATPQDEARIIRLRGQESFGSMSDDPAVVERVAAAYHKHYLGFAETLGKPFQDAKETLARLNELGFLVGVVTSKARMRWEGDLARYGLAGLFTVSVTGDEAREAKPHPGPVLSALEQLRLAPGEVIFAGDGPQDVAAGRAAGVITVGCRYGFHPDEIDDADADYVIAQLPEILTVVEAITGSAA